MDSAEVRAALAAALPSDALIIDPEIIRSLSHDEAEWAPVGEPLALIRPTSSDHVAASVRVCAGFGVPVTARGAGTGLSGGANAIDGGVIIALDRLNQISLIDPLERLAVVVVEVRDVVAHQLRQVHALERLPHQRRFRFSAASLPQESSAQAQSGASRFRTTLPRPRHDLRG